MSVKIRLTSTNATELAAAEAALRTILDIPAPSTEYGSKRKGDPTLRRYLEADGVRTTAGDSR